MTPKEATRLAVYALGALVAAIIAIIAYLRGDLPTVWVALGWIGTGSIAAANVPRSAPQPLE